ncbi:MAG TPA: cytochrome C [Gammaproteobacteria bacterium]|nr:cytochrome C [Gammaproteobacteria bacterium]
MTVTFPCGILIRLFAGLLLALSAATASAGRLHTLMMPGPLIQDHAKYEEQCEKCHRQFSKTGQKRLCLDCHEKIAADIENKRGHHGRSAEIRRVECRECHGDHLGRKADVLNFDPETFDHQVSDFPLRGAHAITPCRACHKPGKKFREAPGRCNICHKDDDVHKGRLGKKCQQCHNERGWTKARFDHDKTDFPLKGRHRKTPCKACHPNERYKHITTRCYDCHRLEDVHQGRYGRKCRNCHREAKWSRIFFDHDKDTKYKLVGGHKQALCDDCHKKGNIYKEKTPTLCYDCHRSDDFHKGRYGRKCKDCHTPRDWGKARFDHDKTDFPLRGRHEKVPCDDCHTGDLYKDKLKTQCYACHRLDDVHKGESGKRCERCHDARGWGKRVVFDHDLSRFPLIGLHAVTPCEECHLDAAFRGAARECAACHRADDEHKGRLGPHCNRCHNPNGWALWRFDHDKDTDYKLTGAHRKLLCKDCHQDPVRDEVHLATACGACHREDDPHEGGFGSHCERCHNTDDFEEVEFSR